MQFRKDYLLINKLVMKALLSSSEDTSGDIWILALYSIEEKPKEDFKKQGFPGMESTEDNILVGDMYLVK